MSEQDEKEIARRMFFEVNGFWPEGEPGDPVATPDPIAVISVAAMSCVAAAQQALGIAKNRVDELLEHNTTLRERLRLSDRKLMVREFHAKFDQTIGERPDASDEKLVRFRMRLIAEELLELVVAAYGDCKVEPWALRRLHEAAKYVVETCPVRVDLPAFVDACVDLSYVLEGSLVSLGVDSTPVWAEVQKSNMAKTGGTRGDGKIQKGPEWVAPDIEGELRRQGWTG